MFKVKRHLDNKLFFLKCTAQSFDGSEDDLYKADILSREIIAFNKFRHKCILKGEACWFEIYNMDSTFDTPSLSQPFNLFDLPPQTSMRLTKNNKNCCADVHAKGFLSAILDAFSESKNTTTTKNVGGDTSVSKIVVVFNLLEYIPTSLHDILNDKGFQLTEDDKWNIAFHLASFIYFYNRHKHTHLQLNARHILIEIDHLTSTLTPKLLDYGANLIVTQVSSPHDLRYSTKYLPPEVMKPDANTHLSSDVFGLGLVFLQLFAHPASYDFPYIYNELTKGKTECLSQIVLPSDTVFLLEQMLTADVDSRPEPCEILDYMVPFVNVDFVLEADKIQALVADRQHLNMLTQLVETILYVELKAVEANIGFKKWLEKIPETLWEAVLQNRAKYESEQLLKDENHATRIDYEYLMNKYDAFLPSQLRTLDLKEEDVLKLVIFLLHKRYQLDDSDENPDVIHLFNQLYEVLL